MKGAGVIPPPFFSPGGEGAVAYRRALAWLVAGALLLAGTPARADDAPPGAAARADALMDAGRYADAAALLERATAAAPGDAGLVFRLGVAYGNSGRDEEALAAFERAVALDPRHAEARYDLGALLFKAGRFEEAAAAFLAIPPLNPTLAPAAYLNAGLARYRQGRLDEAGDLFERAAAGDPGGPTGATARRMLAVLATPPRPGEVPEPRAVERPWLLQATAAREYDSNVLLAPDDPTITHRADARAVATLRAGLRRAVGALRLEPEYSLYARWYDTESAYDFRMHRLALGAEPAHHQGLLRVRYSLALTDLGGRGYLDFHEVSARLRVLGHPRAAAWLEAKGRRNVAADPRYDYLGGREFDLAASGVVVAGGGSTLYGALSLHEADLGDLDLAPGEFRSYSYLAVSPFVHVTVPFGRRAKARLGAQYELRRYRDADRWTLPAPGSKRRRDRRFVATAELEVALAGPVSVAATWRGEQVRSNIGNDPGDYADRDYVRNIYGGALKVAF
jgi:tetratricopeptide (TPR) repeat protein